MTEPFLGEIKLVGFNFAPRGFAQCDGQILPIAQNQSLFSLLGTTYGGDGSNTFALPDLRGRFPLHEGPGDGLTDRSLGSRSGEESHTLSIGEMPSHRHAARSAMVPGVSKTPAGLIPGEEATGAIGVYGNSSDATLSPNAISNAGSSQGHENMQPFLVINFVIALQGLFPSRD